MDPQHLKAFIIIAETGSFSAAAAKLYLTQPAISKRIALLEGKLGASLFDRIGKNTQLTQTGSALLPYAREIIKTVDDATQAMHDLKGSIGGSLSIVTSHHIGLHRLQNFLHDYVQRYPDVKISLHFLDSEHAYEAVLQGRFDLGIITLAPEPSALFNTTTLWQETLIFAASAVHPLAHKKQLTLSDLCDYQSILPERDTYTTRLVAMHFDKQNLPLEINMVSNHLDTMKMLATIGLGWTVLPEILMNEKLCALNIGPENMTRTLGVITHKKRHLSKASEYFLALLKNKSVQ